MGTFLSLPGETRKSPGCRKREPIRARTSSGGDTEAWFAIDDVLALLDALEAVREWAETPVGDNLGQNDARQQYACKKRIRAILDGITGGDDD